MKAEESRALISYRMERSHESLRAAEIMFESSMLAFSMNRVYYAMFYAVQALLVSRKVSFSKHGQVKAYFNREMIKRACEFANRETWLKIFESDRPKEKTFEFEIADPTKVADLLDLKDL